MTDTAPPDPVAPDAVGAADRVITVPNLVTLARLACLPLFLYLLFGRDDRANAAWLLGGLGATDWVDGYLARRLGQVSEFGKKFDPTVDRLLFIVGVGAILLDDVPPTWFFVLVIVRELLVGVTVAIATVAFDMVRFDVTYLGKLATFLLMFAVPGFLLGASDIAGARGFEIASWILGLPGLAVSWYVAATYVPRIRSGIRAGAVTAAP